MTAAVEMLQVTIEKHSCDRSDLRKQYKCRKVARTVDYVPQDY